MSRLSWVRFFPEDFLGGTQQMDCRQVGQYILALCAQWGAERGAERTGLRTGNGALRAVLRGEEMDPEVRSKFDEVELETGTFLRNRRMSMEIESSLSEWGARVKGAERTAERTAEHGAERGAGRHTTTTTTKEHTETDSGDASRPGPKRPRKLPPESASAVKEACEDWTELLGGTAPGSRIAGAWPGLLKLAPWADVRPVWRWYLSDGKRFGQAQYCNPQDFASKFNYWRDRSHGLAVAPRGRQPVESAVEANARVLEAVEQGRL